MDVLIPRGGAGLIRAVAREASVPVIRTGEGVCHVYIDDEADLDMGAKILFNAKCSRPSVCNAAECVAGPPGRGGGFWQKALPLLDEKGVELRADGEALELLGTRAVPAEEIDWDAEYDDYILAVKTVGNMEEAVGFINAHGTGHSEAIITRNYFKAQHFLDQVDAAAVYVNAPPGSPTAASSAWGRRSASPPRRCTPGAHGTGGADLLQVRHLRRGAGPLRPGPFRNQAKRG